MSCCLSALVCCAPLLTHAAGESASMVPATAAIAPLIIPSIAPLDKPPRTPNLDLLRHDAGTYYVDAEIQGYGEVSMLVDTGASYLVINEQILQALQKTGTVHYTRGLDGMMADGTRRQIPVYRLSALRLGPTCWVRDVEAAVFAAATRPILGMNVLARLAPFTFTANPPQLSINCEPAGQAEFSAVDADAPAPRAGLAP